VRARAAQSNPADRFSIGFFTFTDGKVPWRHFTPSRSFSDYELTTTLGAYNAEQPEIYFGIWPDTDGNRGVIEVEKYEIVVVSQ